ncbi:hypothetical protein AZZ84_002911, partial [Escherichia coli]
RYSMVFRCCFIFYTLSFFF